MKLLAILIMLVALFFLYRIAYPKNEEKKKEDKTPPPAGAEDYEPVVKSRFVLPDRRNMATAPAQHEDSQKNIEKQDKKADIFAAGNDSPLSGVIPPGEVKELFDDNEVNPADLDIEKDETEAAENDHSDLDADEEAEEIRGLMGEIEGYAGGFTGEELTTLIHDADKEPEKMTKASVETLRNLSGTDMFEELVSSEKGIAARITAILIRKEKSFVDESEEESDDSDNKFRAFDINEVLS